MRLPQKAICRQPTKMKQFTDFALMIDDFLNRREANAEATRLLAGLGEFGSISAQDDFLAELASLERAGGLVVKRKRIDGVDTIANVRIGDPDILYRYRGRTPSRLFADTSLEPLRRRTDLPEGFLRVIDEVGDAWSRNVSWLGIRKGEVGILDRSLSVARALGSLPRTAETSIDYRTLSRRASGDSKVLERQMRPIVDLLRRLYPAPEHRDLADDELLASLGVEKLPQPLLIGGPVALDGQSLPNLPFIGVPPEQHHRLSLGNAEYLLTIENYTSFFRHCRELNSNRNGVIIFTGGFPAKAILAAITAFAGRLVVPTFHWGDMDPGGLRIFVHLENALRQRDIQLRPHLMDVETLAAWGREESIPVRPLVAGRAIESAISKLWDALAAASPYKQVEQEELDPELPVA